MQNIQVIRLQCNSLTIPADGGRTSFWISNQRCMPVTKPWLHFFLQYSSCPCFDHVFFFFFFPRCDQVLFAKLSRSLVKLPLIFSLTMRAKVCYKLTIIPKRCKGNVWMPFENSVLKETCDLSFNFVVVCRSSGTCERLTVSLRP